MSDEEELVSKQFARSLVNHLRAEYGDKNHYNNISYYDGSASWLNPLAIDKIDKIARHLVKELK